MNERDETTNGMKQHEPGAHSTRCESLIATWPRRLACNPFFLICIPCANRNRNKQIQKEHRPNEQDSILTGKYNFNKDERKQTQMENET